MDICCPSCGEPWDSYHLLHDEIHETDLPKDVRDSFSNGGGRLDAVTKHALEALGWEFAGNTVVSFTRCVACKDDSHLPDSDARKAERAILSSLMEDDIDGMISFLAD